MVIGRIRFFCTRSEQPISPSTDHRRRLREPRTICRLRGEARTIRTRSSQSRVKPEIPVLFTNAELRHPEQEFFIALFITLVAPISLPFWTTVRLSTPTSQVRTYAMQGMPHWQIMSTTVSSQEVYSVAYPLGHKLMMDIFFVYGAARMREPYHHCPSSCEDNQRARGNDISVKLIRTV